jgi:hypothetical protein
MIANTFRYLKVANGNLHHSPMIVFYNRVVNGLTQETALDCVNQTIVLHATIYGIVGNTAPGYLEPDYRLALRRLLSDLASNWTIRELEECRKVAVEVYAEATAYSEHLAQQDALRHSVEYASSLESLGLNVEEEIDDEERDALCDDATRRWTKERAARLGMLKSDLEGLFGNMQRISARANAVAEWLSDELVNRHAAAEFSIQLNMPHYREFGELPYFVERIDDVYALRQQGGDTLLSF